MRHSYKVDIRSGVLLVAVLCLVATVANSQQRIPDISGKWKSNIGLVYEIDVTRNIFTWTVASIGQKANGVINGNQVRASWRTPQGERSANGRITQVDQHNRAMRIEWSNGVIFMRESMQQEGRGEPQPPRGEEQGDYQGQQHPPEQEGDRPREEERFAERPGDLSGQWFCTNGKQYFIHQGENAFDIRDEQAGRSFHGIIEEGNLIVQWQQEGRTFELHSIHVEVDPSGRAVFIEWSNGLAFSREPFPAEEERFVEEPRGEEPRGEEPFQSLPDISGRWIRNDGVRLHFQQEGEHIILRDAQNRMLGEGGVHPNGLALVIFERQAEREYEGFFPDRTPEGRVRIIEIANGWLLTREGMGEFAEEAPEPQGQFEQPDRREQEGQPGRHERMTAVDISGTWNSSIRRIYTVAQNGNQFTWTVQRTQEQAQGVIEGNTLHVDWSGSFGEGHAEGNIVEAERNGRATKIEWSNGVVFTRGQTQPDEMKSAQVERTETTPQVQVQVYQAQQLTQMQMVQLMPHLTLKKKYNEWVKVGGPIGGLGYDVRFMSNHPRGTNIMFVTDNYSGVNKSVDGGKNWFASNTGITGRTGSSGDAIPVFSLTVDPNKPNIVWAGLKDVKGAYKSVDGGQTWTEVTPQMKETQFVFRGFTIMPGNSNIVFAQGELPTPQDGLAFNKVKGRIYKTEDGGKSWTKLWDGNDLVRYLIINPDNPNILYASCGIFDREAYNSNCKSSTLLSGTLESSWKYRGGVGVLRSKNGGKKWEELNRKNGLNDLYVGSLVMHPKNPNILLAGCGNNAASPYRVDGKTYFTGGVFLSKDGGDSWQQTLSNDIITSVEFSPSDPKIAYAGGRRYFYISYDTGQTWQMVAGQSGEWGPPGVIAGFPIDILVHPSDPNTLFANNYGGGNVKSVDGGKTWSIASQGYTGALMFDLAIHPTNSDIVYSAARSGAFRTDNAGIGWHGLSHPKAMFAESYSIAVHPKNPNILIASQELMGRVFRSTDGGKSWIEVKRLNAIPGHPIETHGFKRIVFAPSNPQVVYAGACRGSNKLDKYPTSQGIFKSTQAGAPNSWQSANDSQTEKMAVNDIAVHPKNHNIVYAATATGGLFKTTNGGQSWTHMKGFHKQDVRSVAIDPLNPNKVYAGLNFGGVYMTADNGQTWHRMIAGMDPNEPVWAIIVEPTTSTVWAGAHHSGVFHYDAIEQQWIKVNKGLSTKAVVDLEISNNGNVLYAATTGEGVFRYEKQP